MRWLIATLMVAMLAGCADSSGSGDGEDDLVAEDSFDEFDLEDSAPEFGVIRGVVIDGSINPVAGVQVVLLGTELNVTTNDSGAFGFKDLEPGVYFLEASKFGYNGTQTSVDVVAGVDEPSVTKILLNRQPGTEPRVSPIQFDGFIACSLQTPAGFATSCLLSIVLGDLDTDRADFEVDSGPVSFMQSEATWEAGLETAKKMCHRIYGSNGNNMVYTCGESNLVIKADADAAADTGNENGGNIELIMWVTAYVDGVYVNVAAQQDFQVFQHTFYNFTPDESWQYSVDGDHPVPV